MYCEHHLPLLLLINMHELCHGTQVLWFCSWVGEFAAVLLDTETTSVALVSSSQIDSIMLRSGLCGARAICCRTVSLLVAEQIFLILLYFGGCCYAAQ